MGTLSVVATPIGNLKDITLRAIEVLRSVDAVACEDTRKTGFLLQSLSDISIYQTPEKKGVMVKPRLISYYEQNELQRIPEIITALKNGLDIALVSDAGTPTISDPGFKLVRECIRENIPVVTIPGPSSVIAALSIAGLPTDKFLYLGYLPKKPGKRKNFLAETKTTLYAAKHIQPTVIFFEAPHRLGDVLADIMEIFGDIELIICRELTKVHEEVKRDTVSHLQDFYKKNIVRGELVILFNIKQ